MSRASRNPSRNAAVPRTQRGAVLFISLILLVVLSLIGIASMQVTTLQERMAGNYYTLGKAFQNAEGSARTIENAIDAAVLANGTYAAQDQCGNVDMDNWAKAKAATGGEAAYVSRIDTCTGANPGGESIKSGGKKQDSPNGGKYQITAVNSDDTSTPANSASLVVIETVYIP